MLNNRVGSNTSQSASGNAQGVFRGTVTAHGADVSTVSVVVPKLSNTAVFTGTRFTGVRPDVDSVVWVGFVEGRSGSLIVLNGSDDDQLAQLATPGANDTIPVSDGTDYVHTDVGTAIDAAGAVMEADTTTASMSFVIDDDSMATASDTKLATSESIKAYVDGAITTDDQVAAEVPITDTGTYYTGTEVETALQEVGADLATKQDTATLAADINTAGAVMEADTTTASMSFVIDEDNLVSDLDTKVPTQQSVKAYVDTKRGVISTQTISGTTGTITSGSDDIYVYVSNAASATIELPTAAAGVRVTVHRSASTQVQVDPGSGDSLFNPHDPGTTTVAFVEGPSVTEFTALDDTTWMIHADSTMVTRLAYLEDKPVFATAKTDSQTITEDTYTLVAWDAADIDTHSAFDNANDKYVIPKSGAWRYDFTPTWDPYRTGGANTLDNYVQSTLYDVVGAGDLVRIVDRPVQNSTSLSPDYDLCQPQLHGVIWLDEDDEVGIRIRHSGLSARHFNQDSASDLQAPRWSMEWLHG